MPPDALRVIDEVISDLVASGAASHALATGDRAPSFRLLSDDGNPVSSEYLLADGPLVIAFYRGLWCSYCNLELEALEDALEDIEARNASLIAVSPQTAANSRRTRREHRLSFPILADPGGATLDAFGIGWTVPDQMRRVLRSLNVDLKLFDGDDRWRLPMPATYVIDVDSVIMYASVHPDYRTRPDPYDLLPVLDRLNPAREPLDIHERYGDRPRDAVGTGLSAGRKPLPECAPAASPSEPTSDIATWFATLGAELDAKGSAKDLSDREHSYAAERHFNQLPARLVAEEILAARLGYGELWVS